MRALVLPAFVAVVLFGAVDASAYPWLINHGYAKCAACHVDPSGSGQLTQYGAALQDLAVRWHADPKELESGEPSPLSAALFGLPQPEWLNISGNIRVGGMAQTTSDKVTSPTVFPILMASDVYATVNLSPVVAHVALGYGYNASRALVGPAAAVAFGEHALMSREHWLGVKFLDDALVVRAGRMPLPFGLRNYEHISWVRQATRSDVNVGQQHGLAVAWQNDLFRTEVMAIAGNYQLRPDAYRERGYAGIFEWAAQEKLALGVSSKLTYAANDLTTQKAVSSLRNEHGVFARYAPAEWLAVLFEGDALIATLDKTTSVGGVGWLQADVQPLAFAFGSSGAGQGVHVQPALEMLYRGDGSERAPAFGGWLSFAWYPVVHTELRFDNYVRQATPKTGTAPAELASLLQLHLYL